MEQCSNCGGSGTQTCDNCQGGSFPELDFGDSSCSICDGDGYHTCTVCNGTGRANDDEPDDFKFYM